LTKCGATGGIFGFAMIELQRKTGCMSANRMLASAMQPAFEKRCHRMKKMLFLGLLSVAALQATSSSASAWFLHCCRKCNDCCTTICCRPYNAFSPCCGGTFNFVGCCPSMNCGYGPQCGPPCFGGFAGAPSCFASGCCDVGSLPAPGTYGSAGAGTIVPGPGVQTAPSANVPQGNPGPFFNPPAPQQINPTAYIQQMQYMQYMQQMQMMRMASQYGQLQQVGYQPAFNPYSYGANPAAQQQVPSYWYGR